MKFANQEVTITYLYRGENVVNGDARKVNSLKSFLRYGFPLDFINSGNPYHIENRGFLPSTIDHILTNNVVNGTHILKHFASFTSDPVRAKYYARFYCDGNAENESIEDHLYEEDNTDAHMLNSIDADLWDSTDHLIVKLDITNSVDAAPNSSYLKILNYSAGHKLLLVNCVDYLTQELARRTMYRMEVGHLADSLHLASVDNEWLVLSLDRIDDGNSRSALLAHGPFQIIHFRS